MAQTYCGKSCSNCTHKEQLKCPGCRMGPGKIISGDCRIAKCCLSKGHNGCDSCTLNRRCEKLRVKNEEPQRRIIRIQEEQEFQRELARKAPIVSRCMSILFLLLIPNVLGSIITNDSIRQAVPELYVPGCVIKYISNILYMVVLMVLSRQDSLYLKAAIFGLISTGGSILLTHFMSPISTGAAMVLSILLIIVSLVATFLEYYAHSVVMEDMDYHLSMSWKGLWKWHFSMYATMIGAIILAGIVPLLSVLAVLAASIGLVVVGIFGAIFLFESSVSARRFADYHVEV